jgi:hypothetical protein
MVVGTAEIVEKHRQKQTRFFQRTATDGLLLPAASNPRYWAERVEKGSSISNPS